MPLQSGGHAQPALAVPAAGAGRWSGSAWIFLRDGQAAALAPAGTLGGSQAGARLTYRINDDSARPLAFSGRFYSPVESLRQAEAALGIDWRPFKSVPIYLLVERRQALGKHGRSAFSFAAYGGVSDEEVGPLRLDAYAQAGVVGMRSHDLFADGSAKLSLPVGRLKVGAGLWGAAQPGAERLDAGPQASLTLPIGGGHVIVAADWRLRAAGEAHPGNGPTLTLSAGF